MDAMDMELEPDDAQNAPMNATGHSVQWLSQLWVLKTGITMSCYLSSDSYGTPAF